MLNVLLSAPLFFQLFSDIAKQKSNSSEDPNSDDNFFSTKSFRTNDFPKSTDGNTDLQSYCVSFLVLMYFKMTLRMMKRKQVVFWFAFAVYPYNFLFILSDYIYQVFWHSFLGKNFSLKFFFSNEKQLHLYLKSISAFFFYSFSQIDLFQLYYAHVTSVRFEHSVCREPLLASFLYIPNV